MGNIKEIVLTLCTVLVVSGFFLKLFPKTKLEKNVKLLFSAIILILIISPLMGGFSSIGDFESSASGGINKEKSEEYYRAYTAEKTLELYLKSMENFLSEKGIDFDDITIEYDFLDDAIEIKRVVVLAGDSETGEHASEEIKKKFGIDAGYKAGE